MKPPVIRFVCGFKQLLVAGRISPSPKMETLQVPIRRNEARYFLTFPTILPVRIPLLSSRRVAINSTPSLRANGRRIISGEAEQRVTVAPAFTCSLTPAQALLRMRVGHDFSQKSSASWVNLSAETPHRNVLIRRCLSSSRLEIPSKNFRVGKAIRSNPIAKEQLPNSVQRNSVKLSL